MGLTPNQQQAVRHAGTPLFIQAGAGTGKTFTLTKRLAYGLSDESGPLLPGVESVLTITFTNKAAAELLGRVRAELRAQGLGDAALGIDAAWISTIHSMCKSMLSAHALQAGIDPGMELLSEEESEALLQQAVDELLPRDDMQELIAVYGPEGACSLVSQLAHLVGLAPAGAAEFSLGPQVTARPLNVVRGLCEQLEANLSSLEELGVKDAPSARCALVTGYLEDMAAAARELAACPQPSWEELSACVGSLPLPKGGNLKKAFREDFAEACDAASQALALAAAALARQRLERALSLAQDASCRHCALKERRGVQDTNDLLIRTYRLLQENPGIARSYRERFGSVMVDEFQDTDSLQVGIIGAVCDDQLSTLTTVGDKQQSIYRFRGADPVVYESVKERMAGVGGVRVALDTNFRSHPHILSFVEAVFSNEEFWGDGFLFIKAGQANARPQAWLPQGSPRVEMLLAAGSKNPEGRGNTPAAALREAEAELIAERFEQLAKAGAAFGSMALLMYSTKSAAPYLAALRRRGIPCAVSGGSDFFTLPEVGVMTALLRVLELPDDDKSLLELLASPLFDLPDGDLLALRFVARHELRNPAPDDVRPRVSLWDALCCQAGRLPFSAEDPLLRAHGLLLHALGQLGCQPLHQIAWQLVEDSGWLEELRCGGAQGMAAAANIQRFCDLLAQLERREGPSAVKAGEHFAGMREAALAGAAKGRPGRMAGKGANAVQVMTIHASKGLEFPIVAVAQYERSAGNAAKAQAAALTEGGQRYLLLPLKADGRGEAGVRAAAAEEGLQAESLAAATGAVAFSGFGWQQSALEEQQEQERLLYVALTRARELLIMVSSDKSCASTGALQEGGLAARVVGALFGSLPEGDGTILLGNGTPVAWRMRPVPWEGSQADPEDDDGGLAALPPAQREHVLVSPRAHLPLRRSLQGQQRRIGSYSALAAAAHSQEPPAPATPAGGHTVSAVGSAFHLVAQWAALQPHPAQLAGSGALESRLVAASQRYGLDDAASQRLRAAVGEWLASPRCAGLASWPRRLPEQPFCVQGPCGPLEGSLDLLCCTPGASAALVLDYKTGFSGNPEELRQRYALQAAVYAYALLSGGGYEQVEFVFVRPETGMQELSYSYSTAQLGELAALIADA